MKNSIQHLVRENIQKLTPYSSARDEFGGSADIFLDANENPYGNYNRYPDPYQRELKKVLGELWNIPTENLFIGNGSDEIIDLLFRIFCTPHKDKALTFSPTYGMYKVSAQINAVELIEEPLTEDFQIDIEKLKERLSQEPTIKLIFICSPNNPTGNNIDHIEQICSFFKGIVVVDEAYIDFSSKDSWANKIEKFSNLLVSRTLSKAYAMASLRLGIAVTSKEIINWLNKVKPPYNISQVNQEIAIKILKDKESFNSKKQEILNQKKKIENELFKLSYIEKVYPSEANFILIKVKDADFIYNCLMEKGIIIRSRNKQISNTLRITVGTAKENEKLLKAMQIL